MEKKKNRVLKFGLFFLAIISCILIVLFILSQKKTDSTSQQNTNLATIKVAESINQTNSPAQKGLFDSIWNSAKNFSQNISNNLENLATYGTFSSTDKVIQQNVQDSQQRKISELKDIHEEQLAINQDILGKINSRIDELSSDPTQATKVEELQQQKETVQNYINQWQQGLNAINESSPAQILEEAPSAVDNNISSLSPQSSPSSGGFEDNITPTGSLKSDGTGTNLVYSPYQSEITKINSFEDYLNKSFEIDPDKYSSTLKTYTDYKDSVKSLADKGITGLVDNPTPEQKQAIDDANRLKENFYRSVEGTDISPETARNVSDALVNQTQPGDYWPAVAATSSSNISRAGDADILQESEESWWDKFWNDTFDGQRYSPDNTDRTEILSSDEVKELGNYWDEVGNQLANPISQIISPSQQVSEQKSGTDSNPLPPNLGSSSNQTTDLVSSADNPIPFNYGENFGKGNGTPGSPLEEWSDKVKEAVFCFDKRTGTIKMYPDFQYRLQKIGMNGGEHMIIPDGVEQAKTKKLSQDIQDYLESDRENKNSRDEIEKAGDTSTVPEGTDVRNTDGKVTSADEGGEKIESGSGKQIVTDSKKAQPVEGSDQTCEE